MSGVFASTRSTRRFSASSSVAATAADATSSNAPTHTIVLFDIPLPVEDVDGFAQRGLRRLHDRFPERGVRVDREADIERLRAHLDREGTLRDDVARVC